MSEYELCRPSEGVNSHQGNNKLLVRPTQTSMGLLNSTPHIPVTRSSSVPHDHRGRTQLHSHQRLCGQSGTLSLDNIEAMKGCPACPLLKVRTHSLSPHNYTGLSRETHITHSTPSLFTYQPYLHTPQQQTQPLNTVDPAASSGSRQVKDLGVQDWHTERWHVRHMLTKENADTVAETLV